MKKESLIPPVNHARPISRRKLAGMRSRAQFSALEARTLYSADLGVSAAVPGADGPQLASAEVTGPVRPAAYGRDLSLSDKAVTDPVARDARADKLASDALFKLVNEVRNPVSDAPLEIVLIDSRVPDTAALRLAFQAEIDGGRNLAVIVVDSQSDGINRVTQMLAMAGQKVSAIHIISHGQDGEFTLGSTDIDSQTLESRSNDFANWSRYLGAGADVLIYGCDVAQDQAGEQFLTRFGELTGADVAASKDLTGAKALGGNWDLEYQSGQINRPTLASSDLQRTWQHVLNSSTSAEITVNQTLPGDQMTGGTVYVLDGNGNVTGLVFNGNKNVSVNDAGDTVVAWTNMSNNDVVVRTFHPDGSAHSNEIVVFDPVAEGDTNPMRIGETAPSVAMRPDGSFVVTWAAVHKNIADHVYAQRYTSEGLALGPRITVSGAAHSYMRSPEIDVDDSGGFVIAYVISDDIGVPANTDPNWSVHVSGFNADGSTRFSHVKIDGSSLVGAKDPTVAVAGDGSFVVAYERHWDVTVPLVGTVTSDEIFASQRNADGTAKGLAFQVNTSDSFVPIDPSVDVSRGGSFVVAFNNVDSSASDYRVVLRQYDSGGNALAPQQTISPLDGSFNLYPSVAIDPNDGTRFIVAWSNATSQTSAYNVVTESTGGLKFQSTHYNVTSDTAVQNFTPSIASNGNLIAVDYRSSAMPLASSNFDVMLVTYIDNTNAYQDIPPTIQAPPTQLMLEDGVLQLTLAAGNAIQVSDPDAAGLLSVTLNIPAGQGSFNIANTSMITTLGGASFGGAITANSVSFKGTLAQINSALAQLTYTPPANFNGTVNFSLSTTELYGANPATVNDVVVITVSAVNDAPQLTIAAASFQTMPARNVALSANSISAQDVDAGTSLVTVEVFALHGNVTITAGSPVTYTAIDRMNGSDHERGVNLTGSLADINVVLAGRLNYASDLSFTGLDAIKVTVNDGGNSGSGGALAASSTISVNVVADVAPVINGTINTSSTVYEDSSNALTTLFGVPAINISDADAGTSLLRLTLDVGLGQFTSSVNSPGILLYGSSTPLGAPVAASHIDVTGTVANLNSFLATLQFAPPANASGTSTFTMVVDDQQGYAQSKVSSARSITIVAVNDAPTASLGLAASTVAEDTWTSLGTLFPGVYVNDIDAGSGLIQVSLNAGTGQFRLATFGKNLFDTSGNALGTVITGTTLTFRGTVSDINAALPSVDFIGPANVNGGPYSMTLAVDDLGNSGGGNLTVNTTQFFSISAVNDRPVLSVGATTATVTENTPTSLSSIFAGVLSFSDVDAGSSSMKLTVSTSLGSFSLDSTGLSLLNAITLAPLGNPAGVTSMMIGGSLSDLNIALQRIQFTPAANNTDAATINLSIDDLGNTGALVGGLTGSDSVSALVNIAAVDSPPSIALGAAAVPVYEDTAITLGSLYPALSISDIDAAGANLLVTLNVANASLSIDTTGLGLYNAATGVPLAGVLSGVSISFKAPLAAINAVLPQVLFTPDPDANGAAFMLQLVVDDLGNTGAVSALGTSDSAISYFGVLAVNDAPVAHIGAQTNDIPEDTFISLAGLFAGNQLSVSDVDAGTAPIALTLSVSSGNITLDPAGLTLTDTNTGLPVTGALSSGTLNLTGSVAQLNAALQNMQYQSAPDGATPVLLTLHVDDLGNTGSGVNGVTTVTRSLSIAGVNDLPAVVIGPANAPILEDTPTMLGSLFSTVSVTDVDAGSSVLLYTVTGTKGSLSLNTVGLGLLDAGTGTPLSTTLSGTTISFKADLTAGNAALQQVLFVPTVNSNGTAFAVTLSVDDLGNTGTPAAIAGPVSVTRSFTVSAVNDLAKPNISATPTAVVEDTPTALGSIYASISISDPDSGSGNLRVTLTVNKGDLSFDTTGKNLFDATTGSALTGSLSGSTISFQGNKTNLNAVLPGIIFTPAANANGAGYTLSMTVDDQGNTGLAPASTTPLTLTRSFSVTAVNDAPVLTALDNVNGFEDTPLVFSVANGHQISVSDPDGNVSVTIDLSVDHGLLTLGSTAGLSFSKGNGSNDSTMTFTGSVAQLNAALSDLIYTPDQNFAGDAGLSINASDNGNSGSGGAKSVQTTLALHMAQVNDLPVIAAARSLAQDAGITTAFSNALLRVTDIESGASDITYTLSAKPALGDMLLNGTVLQAGGNFTQADINAGRISYRSSPSAGGTDTIRLSVQDGNGGSTAPIQLSVAVKAAASFQAGSSSTSSSASSTNTSSTTSSNSVTSTNVTTATAAGKAATDASNAAASTAAAAAVAGGSAAGASFTAASGSDASGAQKQAGSNAGVSTGLSNAAPANAGGAAPNGQGRSEATRLSDAPMAALAPIPAGAPATTVASATEATKPVEIERPAFITPGITLPSLGVTLDKMTADNGFQKEMEKVREDVMHVTALDRGVVASTIGVSASFTIGYILWLVRGGVLISSLLASLPAWRMVDPLPVLGNLGKAGGNKDDKSLEELVEHKNEADKDVEQPEEETA